MSIHGHETPTTQPEEPNRPADGSHERVLHSGNLPADQGGEFPHIEFPETLLEVGDRIDTDVTPQDVETGKPLLPKPLEVSERTPWYKNKFTLLGVGGAGLALATGVAVGMNGSDSVTAAPTGAPTGPATPGASPSAEATPTAKPSATETGPIIDKIAENNARVAKLLTPQAIDKVPLTKREALFEMKVADVDPADPYSLVAMLATRHAGLLGAGLTSQNYENSGTTTEKFATYRLENFLEPAAAGLYEGALSEIGNSYMLDLISARFIIAKSANLPYGITSTIGEDEFKVVKGTSLEEGITVSLVMTTTETVNNGPALDAMIGEQHPLLPSGEDDTTQNSNYPLKHTQYMDVTFTLKPDGTNGTISIDGTAEGSDISYPKPTP